MDSPPILGPELDKYLISCRDRAWSITPSKDEIQRAIASLATPHVVSYTTFETILALERTPSSTHLPLLLTGGHILSSCTRLLRGFCNDHVRLFDYAYGYLCLQVMNLSIEVAKLAQVNALPEFLRLVERSSREDYDDKVITKDLAIHVRKWEVKEIRPRGPFLRPANKLLGWDIDPSTGMVTALSRIGGFTIKDMEILMTQIWISRDKFLKTLRRALQSESYAGWCGIIHLMHNTLVRLHGMGNIDGQILDEAERWKTLIDIIQRYSLCAHHYEEPTVSYLLKDRPNNDRERPQVSALDPADLDQIVGAYVDKAHQHPTIIYAHATRIFGYTMTNCYLDESKLAENITRITEAALSDAWAQFGMMRGVNLSVWTYFTDSVINTLIFVPAFSKFLEHRSTILGIIVNENLLDFLGYFVLYPLITNDKMIIQNRWYWQRNTLKVLYQFIPQLKEHMEDAPTERINSLHSTWSKTAQCLQSHKVMKMRHTSHEEEYIHTWELTWSRLWEAIDLYPSKCGYPRCPAPEAAGELQCAGCAAQWYCSRRCQQA